MVPFYIMETNRKDGTFRWWIITCNNPANWKETLAGFNAEYCIGQLEKGEQGTPHLQAALYFASNRKGSYFKDRGVWAKGVKVADAQRIIAYCRKNDTRIEGPLEIGKIPQSVRKDKDWDNAKDLAIEGRINEIQSSILIPHLKNILALRTLFSLPVETPDVKGIWIYGPPGSGKTHRARSDYGDIYIKPQNKWFDGYMGQKTILLDDLDQSGKCLGHHLKIWADKWACYGEVKGATLPLCHTTFIVTSNYSIDEIWNPQEDQNLNIAITRRFQIIWHERIQTNINIPDIDIKYNSYFDSLLE